MTSSMAMHRDKLHGKAPWQAPWRCTTWLLSTSHYQRSLRKSMNQFKNLSRGTLVSTSNGYLTTPWQSDRIAVFESKMFRWRVQECGAQRGELNWKYNDWNHFHVLFFFFYDNADFSWPSVSLLRSKRLRVSSWKSSTEEEKKWRGLKEETVGRSEGLIGFPFFGWWSQSVGLCLLHLTRQLEGDSGYCPKRVWDEGAGVVDPFDLLRHPSAKSEIYQTFVKLP